MNDTRFLMALGMVFVAHLVAMWLMQRLFAVPQTVPAQLALSGDEASRLRPLQWLHSLLFAVLFTTLAAGLASLPLRPTKGLLLGFGAGLLIYGSELLWHLGAIAALRSYFVHHAAAGVLASALAGLLLGFLF